jgi:hypothetical protein
MAADRVDQSVCRFTVVDEVDCAEEDDLIRCDLLVVEDDEGAGEPVNPDPVVPTVGAN